MSPKRLYALAAVAIVIAIGALIFDGELNNFARRLMYVVLVGGILLGATLIVAGEGLRSEPSATLNRSRIHQAQSRPNLLLGADCGPVLLTGLAAVILIFVVLMPYSAHFRIAIWMVVVAALRMIAPTR